MFKFLRNLIDGGDGAPASVPAEAVSYLDYTIQPTPQKAANGWQVRAVITRELDGEICSHQFIRADAFSDPQTAIDTTILKAKRTIDEQGDRLFK